MKQRRLLRVFLLAILVLSIPLALAALSYVRAVRLSLVEGEAWVSRPGSVEPEKALVNLPLVQDTVLETGDGFAEVEFESGLYARLAAYSRLSFEELALADNGGRLTTLLLSDGTATFSSDLGRQDSFRVRTPFFEVLISRRTRFRVDRTGSGARVRVFSGQVQVESPQGRMAVSKGRMFEWEEAAQSYALVRNPARDEWDAWNEDRETALEVAAAPASFPTHLRYGLFDLQRFGHWAYLPSFGHVWRPWVAPGWLPFSYGRWSLYPGFGWTWVSYEPWGWLPYHYGGWYYDPFWGWVWVPGTFNAWSPARCYWVRRGGWVGWGPLGPDDQPVGTASGGSSLPSGGGSRGEPAPRRDVPPSATLVVSEEGFTRGEVARPVREVLGREGESWSIQSEPPSRLADVIERARQRQAAGAARTAPAPEAEGSTSVPRRTLAPSRTERPVSARDAAGETRGRTERLPAPRIPAAPPRVGESAGSERQAPARARPEGRVPESGRRDTSPRPSGDPGASRPAPPPRPAPSVQPPRPSPPPPPPPREKPPPPPRPDPPASSRQQ